MKVFLVLFCFYFVNYNNSTTVKDFLSNYEKKASILRNAYMKAYWDHQSNITEASTKNFEKVALTYKQSVLSFKANASKVSLDTADENAKRKFSFILRSRISKNQEVIKKLTSIEQQMRNIFSKGKIPYRKDIVKSLINVSVVELKLNNDLRKVFKKSKDEKELRYVWEEWRERVGKPIKPLFVEFVRLSNIGARENGFKDIGEFFRKSYEVDDLEETVEKSWEEMKPYYLELHAYIRYRLKEIYPEFIKDGEAIPAHLLGDMHAQNWLNVYPYVKPFPAEPSLDVSAILKKKKYNVTRMFKVAEEFFVSIGWPALPNAFWEHSILERPKGVELTCHASAWDMTLKDNGSEDVRVKMCTNVNEQDFVTVHHELGHIYYYLFYWNLPFEYRGGANPGFHEAVGDTMSLSVGTPHHLQKIGLLENMINISNSKEADINFLLRVALDKIAFLPFGYTMDKWRWGVFSGETTPEKYNEMWWKIRLEAQGVKPPTARSDEDFFDPGAKFHIPANVPYIRYFFAYLLQFTFHKHACQKTGTPKPLHQCSIYKSKPAGDLLRKMLSLGKSKHWKDVLEELTGSREMSSDDIKEYFDPLHTWLKQQRKVKKYTIGWKSYAICVKPAIMLLLCAVTLTLGVAS